MEATRLSRTAIAAVCVAFALLGLARLNGLCLLEPDSPEYLFGAASLASLDGYLELDHPGRPPHTLRPPGLSLLLAPVALVAPYAVAPAKLAILASALVALALLGALVSESTGWRFGPALIVLLVATSPYTLLHATEVVTEVPYLACTLGVILLVTGTNEPPSRGRVVCLAVLLSLLPLLRTIGLAMTLACAIWLVLDRSRRAWWPAPLASIVVSGLWLVRNHAYPGPTYLGAIADSIKRRGAAGYGAQVLDTAGFYARWLFEILLPGVWPGRPLYERMTVGGTPDLGGLHGLGWVAAAAIVALALAGLLARPRLRSLVAMYAGAYVVLLIVYPPRHERLLWPLVPLAWALVPSGFTALGARVSAGTAKLAAAAVVAAALALCAWQAGASVAMASDNLAWRRTGDAFYAQRIPPLYFADWQAAGRFLHDHAPKDARVLTRHSDVGLSSRLWQDSARFEELSPASWRARIARLPARYLAVPTSLFGKFFPMEILDADPAYSYRKVYEARDVAVLEVLPNRTGVVAPTRSVLPALAACESALATQPPRVDLQVRRAQLLCVAGRRAEAIDRLSEIVRGGEADVLIVVTLAEELLDEGRDAEALAEFRRAATLPEADLVDSRIERGRATAEERGRARGIDKYVKARVAIARAKGFMEQLRWSEAYAAIDEAGTFDPQDPLYYKTLGEWLMFTGHGEDAAVAFGAAGGRGDAESSAIAPMLRKALAVESQPDTADGPAVVRAAGLFASKGMPGRALALLERAAPRLQNDAVVAQRLAELRRFYGLEGGTSASF